jgi:hypothetical protein
VRPKHARKRFVQGNLHKTLTTTPPRPRRDLDCIAPASSAHARSRWHRIAWLGHSSFLEKGGKLACPKSTGVWWYLVGPLVLHALPAAGCQGARVQQRTWISAATVKSWGNSTKLTKLLRLSHALSIDDLAFAIPCTVLEANCLGRGRRISRIAKGVLDHPCTVGPLELSEARYSD